MVHLPEREFLKRLHWRKWNWRRQPAVWLIAAGIGILVGYAVIAFRLSIDFVSMLSFGSGERGLIEAAREAHWLVVLLVPTLGGLAVGYLIQKYLPKNRAEGVADVIDARALKGGQIPARDGFLSAVVSSISLGVGASTGREGPAVHIGASLASHFSRQLGYSPRIARTLLAAGVASAVAASFNAPIAGVLFALEVILGHYALRAFGPIVIASVAGALVARLHIGDMPAFVIPHYYIQSYWEMPAFAILGVISALVAVVFMRSVFTVTRLVDASPIPLWARPAGAGFIVGLCALKFPEILGVGYGATDAALKGDLVASLLLLLIAVKIFTTSISLAGRFGGGVFSPSLFLGAMTGGAFGILAGHVGPELSSASGLYAIIGMGAVSAAILGAPISTTLIVFELTGDYNVMIALMVATSIATVMTQAMIGRSIFHLQIESRGYHIAEGPQRFLLETIKVEEVMTSDTSGQGIEITQDTPLLHPEDKLEKAFKLLETSPTEIVLVVEKEALDQPIGYVYHKRALEVFNKALIEANIEEHL